MIGMYAVTICVGITGGALAYFVFFSIIELVIGLVVRYIWPDQIALGEEDNL